jgi:hypothetical protein
MVSPAELRIYLRGVAMLARNDTRGFSWLDLSADGFWRSFGAILYALPAFVISWLNYRTAFLEDAGQTRELGFGFFLSLAIIDLVNWLLPILIVGLVAVPLGISSNFGRWVIATNWLSLPITYLMAIPVALSLVMPGFEPIAIILSLVFFGFAVALFFRVTRLAFDNDVQVAIAITVGLVIISFAMTGALQGALGIGLEPATPSAG